MVVAIEKGIYIKPTSFISLTKIDRQYDMLCSIHTIMIIITPIRVFIQAAPV